MSRDRRRKVTELHPLAKKLLKHLQANLKSYRTERGWTQEVLASRSKLSISTIAEIEQGRMMNITIDTYCSIVEGLGLRKDPLVLLESPKG